MKKFIEFLERNNAWEKFEANFHKQGRNVKEYKKDCKTFNSYHVAGAFIWRRTPEGYNYWQGLQDKWREENQSLKENLLSDD